jgi:hypothetical protein
MPARFIPYGRDGVAGVEAEGAVMAGAVFVHTGILGGNFRKIKIGGEENA